MEYSCSPARRSWQGACLLQEYGFCVPRPLAMLERRQAGMVRESLYVSEGLVSQVPLHIYWRDHHSVWSVFEQRQFLRAMADFLRAFHTAGLYAGDMRDANLFVEEIGNADWNFYLVDLDRVRHFPTQRATPFQESDQLELRWPQCSSQRAPFFSVPLLRRPCPPAAARAVLRQTIRTPDKSIESMHRAGLRARNRRRHCDTLPPQCNSRPLGSAEFSCPHPARVSTSREFPAVFSVSMKKQILRRCLESVNGATKCGG